MKLREAREILALAGHKEATELVPLPECATGYPLGTVGVVPHSPKRYILASPWHGWWLKGEGHRPGEDYRGATKAEVEQVKRYGMFLVSPDMRAYLESGVKE